MVNGQILGNVNIVPFKDKFEYHLWHAAFPAAQHFGALDVLPGKIWHFFTRYQEVAGALRQLGKIYHAVLGAFVVGINRGFRPHEANVCFSGKKRRHRFVCPKPGDQCQVNPFLLEVSFFDCHI